jgi:hypothetical protein
MTKVVIVHPGLYNGSNDALINSFASDVLPIQYKDGMTKDDIVQLVGDNTVSHLAFLYHYPGHPALPFFHDLPPSDIQGETGEIGEPKLPHQSKYKYFSDTVIDIIQTLKQGELVVDILTCDLKDQKYKEEVAKIETDLGINIRYSVDKTGNTSSGANWTLESDSVNVQTTYFTEGVLSWSNVLTADISASIKAGTYSQYITWNSSTKTYTVQQNFQWSALNLVDADSYIALGPNEIFDGNNKTIDIIGYSSWQGLFSTTATSLTDAPFVKNLGILNGSLTNSAGYVIRASQSYFKVEKCYSNGTINTYGGGIAGESAGYQGSCTVTNCYSIGQINDEAGSIVGKNAGYQGNCTITNCYTGSQFGGKDCGGIVGSYAGSGQLGNCTISNCYSTSIIGTGNSGGIVGYAAGVFGGNCIITNCYTTGNINGGRAAGITGGAAGYQGTCIITNCYTAGIISGTSGGIVSENAGGNQGNCTITNCVSRSPINMLVGSSPTIINCSTNLNDINNSIYGWDSNIWKSGNQVSSISNYNLPILIAFQLSPWISDITNSSYYDMATNTALFSIIPSAPTITSVTPGDQQLSLAFFPPANNGGATITSYQYSVNSGSFVTVGTSSPIVITGLTNGTAYSIVLRAINSVGNGPSSTTVSDTPITTPGAPTITSITPGNQQLSVAFSPPFNGGSSIFGYEYSVNSGSFVTVGTSSPITITGLTNGTDYSIVLRAINSVGEGATSSVSGTPATTPTAPTITSVTPSNQQLAITFNPPNNGGATITGYQYSVNSGSFVTVGTSSPITITGLTNGTAYSIILKAINSVGEGATSSVQGAPIAPVLSDELVSNESIIPLDVQPPVGGANLEVATGQTALYTASEDVSRRDDQTVRNFYDNQIKTNNMGITSTPLPMFYSYDVLMKFKQGALRYRR